MEILLKLSVLNLLVCTILSSQISSAYVEVAPMILKLDGKAKNIAVTNVGEHSEYITLSLFRVDNPGSTVDDEKRTAVSDLKKPDLFVTPFKFTLGPKQTKFAHLNVLNMPKKEQIYRLIVMPEVNVKPERADSENNMFISVNLGYENIIRHMPLKQTATWSHECTFNGLKLTATGSVRVEFSNLIQNNSVLEAFNVYPDHPLIIPYKSLSGMAADKKFQINC